VLKKEQWNQHTVVSRRSALAVKGRKGRGRATPGAALKTECRNRRQSANKIRTEYVDKDRRSANAVKKRSEYAFTKDTKRKGDDEHFPADEPQRSWQTIGTKCRRSRALATTTGMREEIYVNCWGTK